MSVEKCIRQTAEELGIPYEVCHKAYMSAWKFIHYKAQENKLSVETPIEEFKSLRLNFNVRGIGKFFITEESFKRKNKRYLAIQKFKKEKYDKCNKND
jgi:hypothetical protein